MPHRKLLRLPVQGLSPEAKILLAALLLRYSRGRFNSEDVRRLASGFGMSLLVSRRSLSELNLLRFLSQHQIAGAAGRPRTFYEVSDHLMGLLGDSALSENELVPLGALVDDVLRPKGRFRALEICKSETVRCESSVSGRAALKGLASASNCLLLAVLLCQSDAFGVVDSLGVAQLASMTGLSGSRVEAQLYKLNELGFIRCKISGFSGSQLLGRRTTVYFLNLHHPDLLDANFQGLTLVVSGDCPGQGSESAQLIEFGNVNFLSGWVSGRLYSALSNRFDHLAKHFKAQINLPSNGDVIEPMLQYLLDGYASVLLSHHWSRLSDGHYFVDERLLELTQADFKPWNSQKLLWQVAGIAGGNLFYSVALQMARRLKTQLSVFSQIDHQRMNFRILPLANARDTRDIRAVLALPKHGVSTGSCFLSLMQADVPYRFGVFQSEAAIPTRELYELGLLSKFTPRKRFINPDMRTVDLSPTNSLQAPPIL